jgi:hypothetical protein
VVCSEILAEFEELGHEFELWSQRLITVQNDHDEDLKGKVQQLKADFLEQGKHSSATHSATVH